MEHTDVCLKVRGDLANDVDDWDAGEPNNQVVCSVWVAAMESCICCRTWAADPCTPDAMERAHHTIQILTKYRGVRCLWVAKVVTLPTYIFTWLRK